MEGIAAGGRDVACGRRARRAVGRRPMAARRWQVAKTEPVVAADGAVLFLERISPALENGVRPARSERRSATPSRSSRRSSQAHLRARRRATVGSSGSTRRTPPTRSSSSRTERSRRRSSSSPSPFSSRSAHFQSSSQRAAHSTSPWASGTFTRWPRRSGASLTSSPTRALDYTIPDSHRSSPIFESLLERRVALYGDDYRVVGEWTLCRDGAGGFSLRCDARLPSGSEA